MTVICVASTGGHLAQLFQLRQRLVADGDNTLWVCPETDQSRSILEHEAVTFVPYVAPRDWRNLLRNLRIAVSLLRRERPVAVFSTGAGIALAFLPVARLLGIRAVYIESAARATGPSVTGRVLALFPGVETHCQYRTWASDRWQYVVSIFDDFAVEVVPAPENIQSAVVTLGTIDFPFDGLVRRLIAVLPAGADVLWQTGGTDVGALPIIGVRSLPAKELHAKIVAADVVVAHSGVGSALAALSAGKVPILVPRRSSRGEHIDDHQELIARELAQRGLAIYRELGDLGIEDLHEAAGRRVVRMKAAEQVGVPTPGPDGQAGGAI